MNWTNLHLRTEKPRTGSMWRYLGKNMLLLALGGLFLLGVLLGTLLFRGAQGDTVSILLRMVNGYLDSRQNQSLYQNFTLTCGSSLLFIGLLFLLGFWALSQPAILLFPLFRGLGFGFSTASLYQSFGGGAVSFVAAIMLPNMLLSTLAVLFCCRESLRLSGSFFGCMSGPPQNREIYSLRLYTARFLAAALLCCLAAFVEAILFSAFSGALMPG